MRQHRKVVKDKLSSLSANDLKILLQREELKPAAHFVLDYRFLRGYSVRKIARMLHYSEATIHKIIKDAYDQLFYIFAR